MDDEFWEDLENRIGGLVDEAAEETDEELATEMSSITRLTRVEVKELFPKKADAQKLFELIRLVNEDTEKNEKINKLVANSEKFADIVITLVSRLT
ncbi:MAG: hypothetical protein KJN76_01085 [Eudoraea sp.]|nr:hypothetical protein [Eudoraea sp.]